MGLSKKDNEIFQRAERIIVCNIKQAVAKNIPLTSQITYRAHLRPHGFTTSYWDYKRYRNGGANEGRLYPIYALDVVLVGTRIVSGDHHADMFNILGLSSFQYYGLSFALDYGYCGHSYENCPKKNDYSKRIFSIGRTLQNKYGF